MKALSALALGLFLNATSAHAQECTGDWEVFFDTDPLKKKVISGDSNAGYALYSYWSEPNLKFEMRGKFPKARFVSFETEETRFPLNFDHLFDSDIDPDEGSENPYRNGVALDTPNRNYTVWMTPEKAEGARNTVGSPGGRLINALLFRVYRPNDGVKIGREDLPRIFAKNLRTGRDAACPKKAPRPTRWNFPQFLADIYTKFSDFEFQQPGDVGFLGLNQAAKYVYAVTPMDRDEVVAVRFRAPTWVNTMGGTGNFDDTQSDVRYWSLCTNNFPNNEGLACVADHSTTPAADGFTYVVIGTGDAVKRAAAARGFAFIPDIRERRQRVMGMVYRNLIGNPEFAEEHQYQGEYLPTAKLCSARDFVAGGCRW